MMQIEDKFFDAIILLKPNVFEDHRGFFFESYSKKTFQDLGVNCEFILEGHSYSKKKGTIRGLHFQIPPHEQTLSIQVVQGSVKDVLVDIRKKSPFFGRHVTTVLSQENKYQLIVPPGFAHGFLTLTDDVHMLYKMSAYYAPEQDRAIRWDDPDLNIDWGCDNPVVSDKDACAGFLKNSDMGF